MQPVRPLPSAASLSSAGSPAPAASPAAPRLSVVVPVRNSPQALALCLESLLASGYRDYELIVVDDASTDETAQAAEQAAVELVRLERQRGPAAARNTGARLARGSLLAFLDADVLAGPHTLRMLVDALESDPALDAVFGSYDTRPAAPNLVSQYKNLAHHHLHQEASPQASSFWAGCGAVRRDVFLAAGGFSEQYDRPCVEDIELGLRLRRSGRRIRLDRDIQVTHLKCWTLAGLVHTDVTRRAVPWGELILRQRSLPDDLNLKHCERVAAALACALALWLLVGGCLQPAVWLLPLAAMGIVWAVDTLAVRRGAHPWIEPSGAAALAVLAVSALAWSPFWTAPALALTAAVVLVKRRLFAFFTRERGAAFAFLAVPLQVFYYLYSTAGFAAALCRQAAGCGWLRRRPPPPPQGGPHE